MEPPVEGCEHLKVLWRRGTGFCGLKEKNMAKFLAKAKYTAPNGVKGLITDGGTKRVEAVRALAASLGGKVESFYFAFGETDAFVILDLPDNASAAAASLTVSASGSATVEVVPLLSAEEIDAAAKKTPTYRAPGA